MKARTVESDEHASVDSLHWRYHDHSLPNVVRGADVGNAIGCDFLASGVRSTSQGGQTPEI